MKETTNFVSLLPTMQNIIDAHYKEGTPWLQEAIKANPHYGHIFNLDPENMEKKDIERIRIAFYSHAKKGNLQFPGKPKTEPSTGKFNFKEMIPQMQGVVDQHFKPEGNWLAPVLRSSPELQEMFGIKNDGDLNRVTVGFRDNLRRGNLTIPKKFSQAATPERTIVKRDVKKTRTRKIIAGEQDFTAKLAQMQAVLDKCNPKSKFWLAEAINADPNFKKTFGIKTPYDLAKIKQGFYYHLDNGNLSLPGGVVRPVAGRPVSKAKAKARAQRAHAKTQRNGQELHLPDPPQQQQQQTQAQPQGIKFCPECGAFLVPHNITKNTMAGIAQ